ncbi:alginate export family protein [Brevundimonas sp.]|uniref:alginate export family protein n=1 Tax=Brevundimonas sp. TaxID=1871086 RepID=UPI0025BCDC06|nr:alginate export family protein [Brevundimonas sp.]MCG2664563.1 alginate export family protein [Brevundimonas sp.]
MTVRKPRRGMRRGRSAALTLLALAAVPASAKAQDVAVTQTPEPSAPYPRAAIGVGSVVGGYAEARWAEDWSALRDPERRKDVFDRLKYTPLSQDGEVWLSLSGEMRLRTALTTSPGLREGADLRLDTLRLVGGADLHIGRHLRVFGEMAHGGAGGDNYGNPVGAIRNDLAVTQAFFDVTGEIGGREVGVRYGRQFFIDGSPYLISTRNGATLLTPFNGIRGWVRGEHWRADLFDLHPTRLGTGDVSDDRTDDARRFSGLNVSTQVPSDWFGGSKLYLDPFVWRFRQDARRWGAETAREERTYVGARLWGAAGPAQLDWTLARQTGRFGDRDIEALQVFTTQSMRAGEGTGAPRISLRVDYGSGGGAYDGGVIRNALTPQGVPIFYSYQNVFNPVNMIAVAPGVTVRQGKTSVTGEVQFTWRASERDAVYRATDLPYAGTEVVEGRHVGEVWKLQLAHTISPRTSLIARYEHLAAGSVLKDAGYESSDYLTAWVNFRF